MQFKIQGLHGEKDLTESEAQRGQKEKEAGGKGELAEKVPTNKEDQDTEDTEKETGHPAGLHVANQDDTVTKAVYLGQDNVIRLIMIAVMEISDS